MLSSKPIRSLFATLAVGIVAMFFTACGPIQSAQAIRDGQKSLDAARLAEAEQLAPYPFHRCVAYLDVAKRKAGFSEFEISAEFARIAKEAGDRAIEQARKRQALKQILEQRRLRGNP